jgi:hypothetical protein
MSPEACQFSARSIGHRLGLTGNDGARPGQCRSANAEVKAQRYASTELEHKGWLGPSVGRGRAALGDRQRPMTTAHAQVNAWQARRAARSRLD